VKIDGMVSTPPGDLHFNTAWISTPPQFQHHIAEHTDDFASSKDSVKCNILPLSISCLQL
jgi:hypothetical protein